MAGTGDGESITTNSQIHDVNGEQVTEGELIAAYTARKQMQSDYTQKTQSAAEAKREADAQMAEAQALGSQYQQALAEDLEFFNTQPPEAWASYTPKIDVALGLSVTDIPQIPVEATNSIEPTIPEVTPVSAQAPATPAPVDTAVVTTLTALNARLDAQETQHAADVAAKSQVDLDARVNAVVQAIEVDLPKQYPLADSDLVEAQVSAYQAKNKGTLPTIDQVNTMAKTIHDKFVSRGVLVPAGIETQTSEPMMGGNQPPNEQAPAFHKLDINKDSDLVEDALEAFIQAKLAAQG